MSKTYHKILVGHNGALGDFCSIFPALVALREHFRALPVRWLGSGEREPWLHPLGMAPATPAERKAVRRLYAAETWPEELVGALVFFFVLDTEPFPRKWPDLEIIRGADATWRSPRVLAREQLQARGIAWPENWADAWAGRLRALYGAKDQIDAGAREVLLFPGAGHQAKQWPLVKFFELANRLADQNLRPVFVLGPAEQDRGLLTDADSGLEIRRFQKIVPLIRALAGARAVCGNDCGPLHLAALLRTPGLVLFGPTSRRQWGPPGLSTLARDLPCRPCTRITRGLACDAPECLTELPAAAALQALERTLAGETAQHFCAVETGRITVCGQ